MAEDTKQETLLTSILERLTTIEKMLAASERRAEERHKALMASIELSSIHQRVSSLEIKSLVRN
jgi:hypothetical protein